MTPAPVPRRMSASTARAPSPPAASPRSRHAAPGAPLPSRPVRHGSPPRHPAPPRATSCRATPRQVLSATSLPTPKVGQLVVGELRDLVGQPTAQHIDHVPDAESLPGAQHGGQHLLRHHSAVEQSRRRAANVAGTAFLGSRFLTEAAQQQSTAAGRGFRDRDHRIEAGPLDALLLLARRAFRDAVPRDRHVAGAEQQQRPRR
jgi:hypothetical protein